MSAEATRDHAQDSHQQRLCSLLPDQFNANIETIAQIRQAMVERDSAITLSRDIAFLARLNDIFAPVHAAQVQGSIPIISDEALQTRAGENLDLIERLTQTRVEGCRYLDIGCGRGYNISEAYSRNALRCAGIDLFAGCQKVWQERCGDKEDMQFILGDLHRHDFQGRTFELISSFNSFEHFDDPGLILNRCRSIIDDNGSLFIKFNPIYRSPMGSHQYRKINIPYVQNLFADDIVAEYFCYDKTADPYPGLNRKRTLEFDELLSRTERWELSFYKRVTDYRFAWMTTVFAPELQAFTADDLYVSGMIAVLKPK
ncbi:MAG: class I SAM-dependent methyltransferase [Proteobacteria bacterium]|nr:class I SAM-dependent methyltransferase [Pseudomonadota bacterium]